MVIAHVNFIDQLDSSCVSGHSNSIPIDYIHVVAHAACGYYLKAFNKFVITLNNHINQLTFFTLEKKASQISVTKLSHV